MSDDTSRRPTFFRRTASWVGWGAALVAALAAGYLLRWGLTPAPLPSASPSGPAAPTEPAGEVWTCSMHPEVRLPKPGRCPKCPMALILASARPEQGHAAPRELVTSEQGKALMQIETAEVRRDFPAAEVRMVGKVEYDETRLAHIAARVPGRLDRLYVDYTGLPVRKGDHMVSLYSPELLSAQEELLQALRSVKNLAGSDAALVKQAAEATVTAVREKLRLWGLAPAQVAEIESRGKAEDHITIQAPIDGIVVDKNAVEGMYVDTGTRIYSVADLSHVWVKLDAYESDLMWIRYGQDVEFATVAYAGRVFRGTISFIDPVLNERTRTVKVRLDVPNADRLLKPGMFVKAVVRSLVAAGGRVMDPHLAGKWICPMHPSVVKDAAGSCDLCQMPLVRTESLGYVSVEPTEADKPLLIPASAPLVTGTRAVVYVEVPSRDRPTYEGREVRLGPRAGDWYLVQSGLRQGERVVTRGNFKIDSALQIEARPSMMSPEGGAAPPGHQHGSPPPALPPREAGPTPPATTPAHEHAHE